MADESLQLIYGDEAGNTGPALLDPAQPIFTYAMTDLTPDEARDALACLGLNAAEVHSTALFRRKGGIDRLARFFAHSAVQPARVGVFVIHKKHMVVTKMIDLLVENLAHREGKRDDLELFMREDLEGIEIGYDRRRHPARLPIRELIFCSSEDEPSIQVADIVAGVVTRYGAPFAGLAAGKARSDELLQLNPDSFMVGNVWPTLDVTPNQIGTRHDGGTHPVNAYSELLRRQ